MSGITLNPKRIIVAMSGGVDSSVTAAILAGAGHDVIGVMLHLWSDSATENLCCTADSMALAEKVSVQVGIPFKTVDAQNSFRQNVVDNFIDSHKSGGTPNPCVVCNRKVRWDILLNVADDLKADYIATGHYVRLNTDQTGKIQLLKGVDLSKDQSYVLHGLTQEKLTRTQFPLGEYRKSEIRELARKFNLPVAERPDSQDLCFVGKGGYQDFLKIQAPRTLDPGPITTQGGAILGQHKGLAYYTIGQRKGLGIASSEPYYVLRKDITENQLIIGYLNELGSDELISKDVNWIAGEPPPSPIRANIKIRYKAREVGGVISPFDNGRAHVKFDRDLRDITPDQAAVFYDGEVCLGGGSIEM